MTEPMTLEEIERDLKVCEDSIGNELSDQVAFLRAARSGWPRALAELKRRMTPVAPVQCGTDFFCVCGQPLTDEDCSIVFLNKFSHCPNCGVPLKWDKEKANG